MAIIYSYPYVSTVNNSDTLVISVSDTTADNGFLTKSLTADNLASYVTARVNLNFTGDNGAAVVNLDTQSLSVEGTANEIETVAVQGNSRGILTIGLPDSVAITSNLTVGNNLTIGGDFTGDRGTFTGDLNIADDLQVGGETETRTLLVTTTSEMQGSLSMALNNINNVANPVSQQDAATKLYVDTVCSGFFNFRGSFRADTGEILSGANTGSYLYNCPGGAGTRVSVLTGDYYIVANTGGQFYCSGDLLNVGDSILAVADAAADSSVITDWTTIESDNVEGTGTPNTIPLWTDSQVLGNSNITQTPSGSIIMSENLLVDQREIQAGTMIINGVAEIAGELDKTGTKIVNLADPTAAQDATTKNYVDSADAVNAANIATNTSNISTNTSNISSNTTAIGTKVSKAGDTMSGVLNMGNNKITNLTNPTNDQDAATKAYVDASSGGGGFIVEGTPNQIDVSVLADTYTVSLPGEIHTNLKGNVDGNVTGDLTGNVTGNLSGNTTGNRVIVTAPPIGSIPPIQNARISIQTDASVGIAFNNINTGAGAEAVAFENGGVQVGNIVVSGSTTSYNTSSDYRLKENVQEMTGAIERISKLEPKRFNFIENPDVTLDGFLAHEVQDIIPEAVNGEKDGTQELEEFELDENGQVIEDPIIVTKPKYQSIDQSKLVPLLVGAVKELIAEVNELKSKL